MNGFYITAAIVFSLCSAAQTTLSHLGGNNRAVEREKGKGGDREREVRKGKAERKEREVMMLGIHNVGEKGSGPTKSLEPNLNQKSNFYQKSNYYC